MKMKQSSSRRVFVDYYTRHVISRDSLPLPWRAHTVARLLFVFGRARRLLSRLKRFFHNETLFSFQRKPNLIEQYQQ
jgi:hypothetical protein